MPIEEKRIYAKQSEATVFWKAKLRVKCSPFVSQFNNLCCKQVKRQTHSKVTEPIMSLKFFMILHVKVKISNPKCRICKLQYVRKSETTLKTPAQRTTNNILYIIHYILCIIHSILYIIYYTYMYMHIYIYIFMVFTTEGFLEVAIESWPVLQFHLFVKCSRLNFGLCLHHICFKRSLAQVITLVADWIDTYNIHHWRILRSSYRKLAWVGFEPTTTEFRSDALTNWAIYIYT